MEKQSKINVIAMLEMPKEYQYSKFTGDKISTFFDFIYKYKIKRIENQIIQNIQKLTCKSIPLFDLIDAYAIFFMTMYAARRYYHIISKFKDAMEQTIGDKIDSFPDTKKKWEIIKTALTGDFPNNSSMNKTNQNILKAKLEEYQCAYVFLNGLRLLKLPNLDDFNEKNGDANIIEKLNDYKQTRDFNNTLKPIDERIKCEENLYKIATDLNDNYLDPFLNLSETINKYKVGTKIPYDILESCIMKCNKLQKSFETYLGKGSYGYLLFNEKDGIIKI